jgi:hypothetical protein
MIQSAAPEVTVPDLENSFSWSASRDRMFRDCPRQYYYAYYGAWGGWDPAAGEMARRLYYLKNLTTLPLWVGSKVHDTVEALLRGVRGGRDLTPRAAADAMVEGMRADYRDSRRDLARERPGKKTRFFDHHRGEEPPRSRWEVARDSAVACVEVFGAMPYLERLRRLGAEAFLALEDLEQWDFDGTPVYLRLDLAFRDEDGSVQIVDWKTGKRKNAPNPLQMLGYATYASETWGVEPEKLAVKEVYLSFPDDPDNHCVVDRGALDSARERIAKSIADMKAHLADPESNLAQEDDFPTAGSPQACRLCFFREVCPSPAG